MVANSPPSIHEVESRPIPVSECLPNRVFVIERDRIVDAHLLYGLMHIFDSLLKIKFRSVHSNDLEPIPPVFRIPCAKIRQCAPPVDTRIRPEVDERDLSAEVRALQ